MATGRARLERQLAAMEGKVRASFRQYLDSATSPAVMDRVSALLERGDISGALRLVDSLIVRLGSFIPQIVAAVGAEEAAAIGMQLGQWSPHLAASFDPSYPRAAELIRRERFSFIQQFTQEQRGAVQQALARGFGAGSNPRVVARRFRDAIGLTEKQEWHVFTYRQLLEDGSPAALQRALRDRRFDSTVLRAVEEGGTLSNEQIDRMVERYREGWLRYRSENIARTEATRAVGLAREEATKQTVEDLGVEPDRIRRRWIATQDARTRDAHRFMQVAEVGMDEPFIDQDGRAIQFPGDPSADPATTINCRCVLAVEVLAPGQREAA